MWSGVHGSHVLATLILLDISGFAMTPPIPVVLTPEQRAECRRLLESTTATSYRRQRALILLLAERRPGERGPSNEVIARLADVNRRTVTRVRSTFLHNGFAQTLQGRSPAHLDARKLTPDQERRLLALLNTAPPAGRERWTVRALASAASELEGMPVISRELVRRLLKRSTPGVGEDHLLDAPVDATGVRPGE
ncbi:MAG: helix-turn-helix domain-containing protein [Thermomicrobiales bacterium]|nr:helix-turn-helix domain-containing protein [Thermomicrobiales bacterium]